MAAVRRARSSRADAPFNGWVRRASAADIGMLMTATPQGRIPAAGLPWLDALFGRDAIITALETLWLWPEIARQDLLGGRDGRGVRA